MVTYLYTALKRLLLKSKYQHNKIQDVNTLVQAVLSPEVISSVQFSRSVMSNSL